jgi:uncharacterized protein (DUF1501 family)
MTNSKTRRDFLKGCCALGAAGMASQLTRLGMMNVHAQGSGYKALVCVFLFGGNDANNTVVPIDSRYSAYQSMRTAVAIPQASLLPAGSTGLGFHPALVNTQRLFNQGRAGTVLNVGTLVRPTFKMPDGRLNTSQVPRNLYSHSDQTQQWQSSDPNGGATGWGGRINDITVAMNTGTLPPGVTVNGGNALFLSGPVTKGMNFSNLSSFGLTRFGDGTAMNIRQETLPQVIRLDSGLQLVNAANGVLNDAIVSAQTLNTALASAPPLPVTFPTTGLGQQLAQVYRIMSVRGALGMNRQIFFAGMGGFDNHEDLLNRQQPLLATLDAAIGAFFNALDATASPPDVTLFTESEFNRTADSNANVGSDHAWGGHHLMFNNSLIQANPATGTRVFGAMPQHLLRGPDDAGDRGYWIPTTALDQYAATFGSWFGLSSAQLAGIFPNLVNFPTQTLGFL